MTNLVSEELLICHRCFRILVFNFPICPTYVALQSLHSILYLIFLLDTFGRISFTKLLSLFRLKNASFMFKLLMIILNLSETDSM